MSTSTIRKVFMLSCQNSRASRPDLCSFLFYNSQSILFAILMPTLRVSTMQSLHFRRSPSQTRTAATPSTANCSSPLQKAASIFARCSKSGLQSAAFDRRADRRPLAEAAVWPTKASPKTSQSRRPIGAPACFRVKASGGRSGELTSSLQYKNLFSGKKTEKWEVPLEPTLKFQQQVHRIAELKCVYSRPNAKIRWYRVSRDRRHFAGDATTCADF